MKVFNSIIVACLLIGVTLHEIELWKKVMIKTIKFKREVFAAFAGIITTRGKEFYHTLECEKIKTVFQNNNISCRELS